MKPIPFSIRYLILLVAAVAISIGGWAEYVKLKHFSDFYASRAMGYGSNIQMRRSELANARQELKRLRDSATRDGMQTELTHSNIYKLQANIAANANLVSIYEHAASHPWEAVPEFTEVVDAVENFPVVKRFPADPSPPDVPRVTDPTNVVK